MMRQDVTNDAGAHDVTAAQQSCGTARPVVSWQEGFCWLLASAVPSGLLIAVITQHHRPT
jgi:hypothetical protein